MPYDPTINSSDIEDLSPRPPSKYTNAGQASINRMIDSAFKDRLDSKKIVKKLTFTKGRPHAQYQNALWMGRFQAFREAALGADLRESPSADDIMRFLSSIIDKVIPRSDNGVPTFGWMKNGIKSMMDSLIFEYSDFSLSPHHTSRISTLVDSFVQQGRLTKKPHRERQWLVISLVKIMADAILRDAVENGTPNWDTTLRNLLLLLLSSALQCRSGDILKERRDEHPLPYIVYGDIALKLVGGSQLEHIQAEVKIRNEKGYK